MRFLVYASIVGDGKIFIRNREGYNGVTIEDRGLLELLKKERPEPELDPLNWNPKSDESARGRNEYKDSFVNGQPYKNPYDGYYQYEKWNDWANAWRKSAK